MGYGDVNSGACFLQLLGGLPEHVAGVNINGGSAVSDYAAWRGRSSIRIQKRSWFLFKEFGLGIRTL
jgi:hypothetical protein